MAIRIIGDSCCDLPPSFVKQHPCYSMMPLSYRIGQTEYLETPETTLDIKTFYSRLRNGEVSKTSQVTPQAICESFKPYFENGDDIVYITLSSALSSGYANSLLAKDTLAQEYPDRKLYIIDSRLAAIGMALLIKPAVEMAEQGKSFDEIASHVHSLVLNVQAWFTVDDLAYLKRGGRLSPTSAFFGSLLNIKPAMFMDNRGRLIAVEKCKGRKRVIKTLLDKMELLASDLSKQEVLISHSDCLEEAEAMADDVRKRFGVKNVTIEYIGPIIGSHTGANTLALFFMGPTREKEGLTPISEPE